MGIIVARNSVARTDQDQGKDQVKVLRVGTILQSGKK